MRNIFRPIGSPRRDFLRAGAACAALATMGLRQNAQAAVAANANSWLLCRGNERGDGVSPTVLPSELAVKWKFEPKGAGAFEATAAMDDGLVFAGENQIAVYAINLLSGEKKWEHPGELGYVAPPSVRKGKVFIGDGGGTFFCLDAKSGEVVWKKTLDSEIMAGANFYQEHVLVGGQDAVLYCFESESGKEVWKRPIGNQIRTIATLADDRAFAMQCDGSLHIFDVVAGNIVATVPINQANTTSVPAVLGDQLFFGTEDGAVMSIDWKKASIAWTYGEGAKGQAYRSSPAVTEDLLVIGGRDKHLLALRPSDGKELWKFPTKGKVDSSPVISGERIYFGCDDGRLYVVDRNGKEISKVELGGALRSSPAVASERLVIGNERGALFCLGAK